MRIGIDASRAFQKQRTGIEEYSFEVIKNLAGKLDSHRVILYVREEQSGQSARVLHALGADCPLIDNWEIKIIKFPYLWTQLGLSLEMLFHPVDVLFVPSHTVPWIHPKRTIVTVHGLEYEILPACYSFWERLYMRLSIKNSCWWASRIIAVSENTKKDLMELYQVSEEKISVIYEGINPVIASEALNRKVLGEAKQSSNVENNLAKHEIASSATLPRNDKPYLLFIGRLEERKNTIGIIRAFEILKERYQIPHKLVLAGKFGYGKEKIEKEIANVNCGKDIILTGFVKDEDKPELMRNADVFLFPTFYEGFGIPILEAQSAGTPVVASDNSSIPEIVGARRDEALSRLYGSALLVNPQNAESIADATFRLISDKDLRDGIIEKGYENVKRFSWDKCVKLISVLLKGE